MRARTDGERLAQGLFLRAAALACLFAVAHLLGWRENTTVLCGMAPVDGASAWVAGYTGAAYVLCYLLATLATPVLLLAAAVIWAVTRRQVQKGGGNEC